MNVNSLEKWDISDLIKLKKDVQKLLDIHEISNLFAKYEYLHTAGKHMETVELFALELNDVSCEASNWGVFIGAEGIKKFFYDFHTFMQGTGEKRKGIHCEHNLATPMIEVAGDGKTAKALWQSPGHETYVIDGEIKPLWTWVKYGVDFIKLNGIWKIWHFHAYDVFTCAYETGWAEGAPEWLIKKAEEAKKAIQLKSEHPATFFNVYSKDYISQYYPPVPEPYETFEGTHSMA